jgi:uncharacterized protein YbdZ (MbtH family)
MSSGIGVVFARGTNEHRKQNLIVLRGPCLPGSETPQSQTTAAGHSTGSRRRRSPAPRTNYWAASSATPGTFGEAPVTGPWPPVWLGPFDDDNDSFFVLVNDEERHSLWPTFADVPTGWRVVYTEADRVACLTELDRYTTEECARGWQWGGLLIRRTGLGAGWNFGKSDGI